MTLNSQQRREISQQEYRKALASVTPNCPGNRYSGQQIAAARRIARQRTLALVG